MPEALILEDDPRALDALNGLIQLEGFETRTAATLGQARSALRQRLPDAVVCDLFLPDGRATELLTELPEAPAIPFLMVTGHGCVDSVVEALRLGAYDYLTKPIDERQLRSFLASVARAQRPARKVSPLRQEWHQLGRFGPLVGVSPVMQAVYELIEKVSATQASVLLRGESGTGKELVARTIHDLGPRRDMPFVALNCGAVSPHLMESELFGHEKGAFTGAAQRYSGLFERADGGTLFLDEVTEMPLALQVKLLRVLETGSVTRVGGDGPIATDVRILSATNQSPERLVREGGLRADLFFRLNVFPITLPPLRRRVEDVELLAHYLLCDLARELGRRSRITPEALRLLEAYPWPGNVRELKNVLRRALILAEEQITPDCLPPEVHGAAHGGPEVSFPIGTTLAEAEQQLTMATLKQVEGNKKRAAELLGISLRTLYNRLPLYG